MEKKKNVFEIEVQIQKDEFEKALDGAFNKKVKEVKVDGFRKGKVPKDIYIKKFGKESLYMEAVDILLPNAFSKALKDNKLEPIIEPKIDLKEITENGCTFIFTITTKPEINIKKYKGLKVKKEEVTVTKEEIKLEIDNMLEKYSELVIKEFGEVENGNIAIIDFEGFKDGVPFDGGKAENYSLEIGSNTFIPGFEDQIVGMKNGEEKDIKVTFPEDYNAEELKGKEVTFKVKVNEIKEKITRELDKEFFEDVALPGIDSKEKLEQEVENTLKEQKQIDIDNKYVDDLLKEIAKNTTIDVPEELIDKEIEYMISRFDEQLKMQGMSIDIYYEMTKTTKEDMKKQMMEEANAHVMYRFILEEIKNIENINATDKEVKEESKKTATSYGMEEEDFIKAVGGLENLKYEVEMKKVIQFLKDNN